MDRMSKAWATRRARYGATGGNQSRDQLKWCPDNMRAEYLFLRRSKRIPAPEARLMIEELM